MLDTETSHREEADNYHTVVFKTETHRVIPCRDGIQWILQRRKGLRHGQPRWASISYCTTRKALVRVWHAKTGDYNGAVKLGRLPERIGGLADGA